MTPDGDVAGPAPRPRNGRIAMPAAARPFQGTTAGLVSRLLANTVDFCVITAAVTAGWLGVAALRFLWNSRTFTAPRPSFLVLVLVGSALMLAYLTLCWVATGRTYGDHLLGLRVVDRSGGRLSWILAAARALVCVAFPLGVFWIPFSRTERAVHDVVLRTSVVRDWSPARLLR